MKPPAIDFIYSFCPLIQKLMVVSLWNQMHPGVPSPQTCIGCREQIQFIIRKECWYWAVCWTLYLLVSINWLWWVPIVLCPQATLLSTMAHLPFGNGS